VHVCEVLLRALQLGLQIDQELLLVRAQTHLFRELAAGSRKGSRSPTGFFPHAAQLRVHVLQLRYGVFRPCLRALQVCAQATHLCIDPSDVSSNGAGHRIEACCCQIARRLVHSRCELVSLYVPQHMRATVAFHSPLQHRWNVLDIARALLVIAPRCSLQGVSVTQLQRQRCAARCQGITRRRSLHIACALDKLIEEHDTPTRLVDANLQILSPAIPAPWDTRRHISNHAHDAAMAGAAGRT